MALNNKSSFLHFLLRFAALTGLTAALVGLVLWLAIGLEREGIIVALAGLGLVAIGLLGEVGGIAGSLLSRRGAMGTSVLFQVVLALLLLAGVNLFSFFHYQRFDWTRDGIFTLPERIRADLSQLRGETTIVVYQRHTPFGQSSDNRQDNYDAAAQRKIVEKVRDLAEQFQDLGPRFRVQLLDIQSDAFEIELNEIQREKPQLADAIEKAPDNSIFFYTKAADSASERVQRLSFHDIYQLDKKASLAANDKRGNLVLNDQGLEPFARKVLNIEEKKPRIGFAVIHEYLGVEGTEDIGMGGVKKSLESRGYECKDIILKQWPQQEPTILTHDEHKFERLEMQLASLERKTKELETEIKHYSAQNREFAALSVEELGKKYAIVRGPEALEWAELKAFQRKNGFLPQHARIDTEEVKKFYQDDLYRTLDTLQTTLDKENKARDKLLEERKSLSVENLEESRRIGDLRAKFSRMLADVDLLILPRMTLFNAALRQGIPFEVYKIDPAQLEALKDYMKSGRPVMYLLGPANEPGEDSPPTTNDAIENLLATLGVHLPNQTILFSSEAEALESWRERVKLSRTAEVPPLQLEWKPGQTLDVVEKGYVPAPNDIRTSLRLSSRGFSKKYPSDLRVRNPRPVYVMSFQVPNEAAAGAIAQAASLTGFGPVQAASLLVARSGKKLDEKAVFLMTSEDAWNDDQPFPNEKRIPHYERAKADDPSKGTIEEKRRGPFPIGVALETELPQAWYEGGTAPAKARLAVIGHGGVFLGDNLTPMREKLLLDTANWLLGRDDLLAREQAAWSFPRVDLNPQEQNLWKWGAWLGLPLIFAYLGTVMLLVRRMR